MNKPQAEKRPNFSFNEYIIRQNTSPLCVCFTYQEQTLDVNAEIDLG
jgi:hypothetical protein